jgi:hypothetical protein
MVFPSKSLISILGINEQARPVQIISKSVKAIKTRTITFTEITEDDFSIRNVEEVKNKKTEFHWKNILPIPHLLTRAYLSLEKFDPSQSPKHFM